MGIQYPAIGSMGPWGSTLNNNFRFIDSEIRKLYETVASTTQLIGANVPYVHIDKDHFFVDLIRTDDVVILQYKTETDAIVSDSYEYNIESKQWKNNRNPELFLAAYVDQVLDETTSTPTSITLDNETFAQSDILVIIQQMGSMYGPNTTPITFKKYIPVADIFLPTLSDNAPYRLKFDKINYVEAFRENPHREYILPSIGLGTFNYLIYKATDKTSLINGSDNAPERVFYDDETKTLTWNMQVSVEEGKKATDYLVDCNFFVGDAPAFVSYTITKQLVSNIIDINIVIDVSGILEGEELRCEQIISHRAWATT